MRSFNVIIVEYASNGNRQKIWERVDYKRLLMMMLLTMCSESER